jgi:hypothetical protein
MSFLRSNNRKPHHVGPQRDSIHQHQRSTPIVVPNVVTYILKRYVSNGRLIHSNCQGGHAMRKAVQKAGVVLA